MGSSSLSGVADAPLLAPQIAPPPRTAGIVSLSDREGLLQVLVRMALADNTAAIGDGGTADFVASSASSTPPSSMTTTTTTKIGSVSYGRSRAISFQHTNDHQVRKTQPITDDENAKGNAFGHDEEQLQMTTI